MIHIQMYIFSLHTLMIELSIYFSLSVFLSFYISLPYLCLSLTLLLYVSLCTIIIPFLNSNPLIRYM